MADDLFDKIARPFRARYEERRAFQRRRALFAAVAREALVRTPNRRCLDLGCGPGVLACDFAALGFDTLGVDASLRMIDEARAGSAREAHPAVAHEHEARFLHQDLRDFLREPQAPAGLVVASSVLEYLDDPVALVRAVASLLAPGGTFAFSIPNRRSLLRAVEPLLQRFARAPYLHAWKNRLRLADYLEFARQLGLRVERVQHFGSPGPLSGSALLGTLTLVVLVRP
jgi:predicted TPR repeat methyltransferase